MSEGNNGWVKLDDVMAAFFAQYKTAPLVSSYLMREGTFA